MQLLDNKFQESGQSGQSLRELEMVKIGEIKMIIKNGRSKILISEKLENGIDSLLFCDVKLILVFIVTGNPDPERGCGALEICPILAPELSHLFWNCMPRIRLKIVILYCFDFSSPLPV